MPNTTTVKGVAGLTTNRRCAALGRVPPRAETHPSTREPNNTFLLALRKALWRDMFALLFLTFDETAIHKHNVGLHVG